jgi:hypothetical protein
MLLRGRLYAVTYIMHVQLYEKGTNPEFDAVGQIDGGDCRTVLTWRKN